MTALSPVQRKFILHWGEMGARWGVNRTVAQIHALLYLSEKPLTAEQVCDALGVARSNVSTSLKELQGWGIVRIVHVMGDRRDHFESLHEVWEMFQIVMDERKKREIDPTVRLLRECLAEAESAGSNAAKSPPHVRERIRDMLEFMDTMTQWYGEMRRLPRTMLVKTLRLGGRMSSLVRGDKR